MTIINLEWYIYFWMAQDSVVLFYLGSLPAYNLEFSTYKFYSPRHFSFSSYFNPFYTSIGSRIAEEYNNVMSWTMNKKKKSLTWVNKQTLHTVSRITAGCQTFSLAWSHYITYSLQMSSVMACFMRPDSLYTDVVVNTYCQCLDKKFSYHHVYQEMCCKIYSFSWVDISGAWQMSSLLSQGALCEALIWHLKTLNMVERIQMHSGSYRNMENSFILSSMYHFSTMTWSRKFKVLLFWTNCCIQHRKEEQIIH